MKTPWSSLLNYGTAVAAVIVISISIVALLIVVAAAVLISKFIEFTS